jgi:hypothetical protein
VPAPFADRGPVVGGGPCAPARSQVDSRCSDAERLALAAQSHQQALRDARREHAEVARLRDSYGEVRDRRRMTDQKTEAQGEYHAALMKAADLADVHAAAANWLRRIDQLNRRAKLADERADGVAQRVAELERALPRLELAADAARIAAEAAQVGCLDARRALAACEEESQRKGAYIAQPPAGTPWSTSSAGPAATSDTGSMVPPGSVFIPAPPPPESGSVTNATRALMRGDRETLLTLSLRLAEETGFEAGRLQLLLLELREQISSRALEELAVSFPEGHPFWSQFSPEGARAVAASLASMGFRFDGHESWAETHSPQVRDLALALSYCGHDPRSLRRPAGQAALDGLWRGAVVRSEEYLLARAPSLTLNEIVNVLGPRSGRLAELWDIWGRLRPLLMRAS